LILLIRLNSLKSPFTELDIVFNGFYLSRFNNK